MEKLYKPLSLAIGALAIIFAFSSCDTVQTITGDYNVYGSAVNVKSSSGLYSGLSNASVRLTNYYNASLNYATSLDSSGNFSFSGIPGGKYKMTGSANSVTFIPATVTISGANTILPNLLAFPSGATNELVVVMVWENKNIDMDLSMAYGDPYTGSGINSNYFSSDIYYSFNSNANWTAIKNRSATGASSNLVEAITLRVTGSVSNGQFRFYVTSNVDKGTTGDLNFPSSQEPAGVTVFVFHGDTNFGEIPAPYNTADTILRMASINIAGTTFTIGPDMKSQTDTVYRGIGTVHYYAIPVSQIY